MDGEKKVKSGLAKDLADLAEKKLDGAPVFAHLLQKTADVMSQAGQQLRKHQRELLADGAKPDTAAVADAARLQKDALTRLENVLKTLEEEKNAPLAPIIIMVGREAAMVGMAVAARGPATATRFRRWLS